MIDGSKPVLIDYYTDLLCVWAWIAQPRLDELIRQWDQQIRVRHRYVDVFGDSHRKILATRDEKDGFEQFHAHVAESAAPFEHTHIHEDVWTRVRPQSSMPSHLLLKAVQQSQGANVAEHLALRLRVAFFTEGRDIGDTEVLFDLAEEMEISIDVARTAISNGSAMAALSDDYRKANAAGVRGSPTWVLNQGRQVLYGNVGYRILHANVEELIRNPGNEASWC